jgi:hypothetical protein
MQEPMEDGCQLGGATHLGRLMGEGPCCGDEPSSSNRLLAQAYPGTHMGHVTPLSSAESRGKSELFLRNERSGESRQSLTVAPIWP